MKEFSPADSTAGSLPEIGPRRRQRRSRSLSTSSSSSSSASSSSSLSTFASSAPSPFPSPSPSPCYSTVPFSWERRPGIPKNSKALPAARPALPRPPLLRSLPDTKRPAADPFAIALAECAKGAADDDDGSDYRGSGVFSLRRRVAALADWFALFDLYGSCKAAGSVAAATVRVPRSGSGRR